MERVFSRLTTSITEDGKLEPLIEALRALEARRHEPRASLVSLTVPAAKPRDVRLKLERYLSDRRGLLCANVAQGQQGLGEKTRLGARLVQL